MDCDCPEDSTKSRALYQDMFSQKVSYHLKFNVPFVSDGIASVDLR